MKRLIKKSENNYDVGDIIKNYNIEQLLISAKSVYGAYKDCVDSNRWSKSQGPLQVWITQNDQFLLVDGYHRLIYYLFNGQQYVDIEIVGIGYSDYWAEPTEIFYPNFSLRWNGLEEFADDDVLEYDYNQYFE